MDPQPSQRINACAQHWHVVYDRVITTPTSSLAFGSQHQRSVVLKVIRHRGDEWNAGAVTAAFAGQGVVRVIAHQPGAALLERLAPATPLVEVVREGRDDHACGVIALLVREMHDVEGKPSSVVAAQHWGKGFERYLASDDRQIDPPLVAFAQRTYAHLCSTQRTTRLLHGDLQHYNILYDKQRGWTAIDPKGVIAEPEFEFGAALRNPHGFPALYGDAAIVEQRIHLMTAGLQVDVQRVKLWAMAQAVLSAIWTVEDHGHVNAADPALVLASTLLRNCQTA